MVGRLLPTLSQVHIKGKQSLNRRKKVCSNALAHFQISESLNYILIYLIWDAYDAGSQPDLDLNLGMSTSSSKENDKLGGSYYHPYDMQDATKSKVLAK